LVSREYDYVFRECIEFRLWFFFLFQSSVRDLIKFLDFIDLYSTYLVFQLFLEFTDGFFGGVPREGRYCLGGLQEGENNLVDFNGFNS